MFNPTGPHASLEEATMTSAWKVEAASGFFCFSFLAHIYIICESYENISACLFKKVKCFGLYGNFLYNLMKKMKWKWLISLLFFVLWNTSHSLHFVIFVVGLEFPWGPKPFAEVVAGPLLRNNRQAADSSSLEGHYVGVYFSAHWVSPEQRGFLRFFHCPPCGALWEKGHRQQSRAGKQSGNG